MTIILNNDCPVWTVAFKRSRYFEASIKFSVDFYALIIFQFFRKTTLHITIVDHIIIDRSMAFKHVTLKIATKFLGVKQFLGIKLRIAQFCVFDAIYNKELHGGAN